MLLEVVYQNFQKKAKKEEHSKGAHSKHRFRENALKLGMKSTPPKYLFTSENFFKLPFCTQLMSDTSHLSQQNIFSRHRQSLSDVSSFILFLVLIAILLIAWT